MTSNLKTRLLLSNAVRIAASTGLAVWLGGCSAGSSNSPFGGRAGTQSLNALPAMAGATGRAHPSNCPIPSVWASSNSSTPQVVGYDSSANVCVTLTGASTTSPFADPSGLATDANGYLYVADYGNARVVVFKSDGTYWSTLNSTSGTFPFSVCVSPKGVVGVGNAYGSTSDMEFFPSKGPLNSTSNPTNSTIGGGGFAQFCAFDKRSDFFATGYGLPIVYLRNYDVNTPSATLQACTTTLCTGNHVWQGMYSHIRPGSTNVLSVGDDTALNIVNFKVTTSSTAHLLNFTSWLPHPTTALSGYPTGLYNMFQIAPTTGSGPASRIYVANFGGNAVERAPNVNAGGLVSQFTTLSGAVGVATRPTGQY